MNIQIFPSSIAGTVQVPASKSLSHRALICAALADGVSTVHNIGNSNDIQATIQCLKAFGASFLPIDCTSSLRICGCNPALIQNPVTLNANESGSTLRFLIPIAAAGGEPVTFLGRPSLLVRPLGIYENIFLEQNLPFEQGPKGLHFHGPLSGGLYTLNGNVSSQFISGLLLAAPLLGGVALAVLPPYQSRSYVDLTVSMMESFGIRILQPTPESYEIHPGQHYQPQTITVESDWSQAAFFLILGTIKSPLHLSGLTLPSLQGDSVIASMVEKAGGRLSWNRDILSVCPGHLMPFVFDLADCPDLGPILCTLGALIPGTNRLLHTSRLRIKECDRIDAMETELRKFGIEISSDEDSITITGKMASSWKKQAPVEIDGHNDHRIVMAMAVFALCTENSCIIKGAEAVAKSYPGFFEDLRKLGVRWEKVEPTPRR